MTTTESNIDQIKKWRERLLQALKSQDSLYAMHCDKMIVNLKTKPK